MNTLAIVRLSFNPNEEVFLLIKKEDFMINKYVSKFEDNKLSDLEIENLFNLLRSKTIKWSHLFSDLENEKLILA